MQEIEQYVQQYFGIRQQNLAPISALFVEEEVLRGDSLARRGQYHSKLSFIKQGYVRMHAPNPEGDKDITHWIAGPGSFVTDLSTLVFDQPARWNMEALSDTLLFSISREDYQRIGELVPDWLELEKLFLAKCFAMLENRMFRQLSMTAEQRFKELFTLDPNLFNQVPLQYIASMMGMTPETLSRVRKKVSQGNA